MMNVSTRTDTRERLIRTSSSPDRTATDPEDLYELLFGRPVLPLEAFSFGRSVGRRMERLFPDQLMHVLRGVRAEIKEIRERGEVER